MKIKIVKAPKWFINLQYIFMALILLYCARNYLLLWNPTKIEDLLGLLIIGILFFYHTHYHEFFHWVTARAFKYRSRVFISRKLCLIKGKIKPSHFFIIALLPFSMEIIILFLLFQLNQNLGFFIGSILSLTIGGFLGDVWMASSSIPYIGKDEYYFKYKKSGEFYLCKKQQEYMSKTTNVI